MPWTITRHKNRRSHAEQSHLFRAPFRLHTASVSIISAAAFLAERDSRLATMVAYTYWRVAEAFVGDKETETVAGPQRWWYGPTLAGMVATFAAVESELLQAA